MSLLGAEYSDSSSSSEDEAPARASGRTTKAPAIGLPSVDEVFAATQRPTFLDKPTVASMEVFDIEERPKERDNEEASGDLEQPLENDEPASPGPRIVNSIEVFPGLSSPTRAMPVKRQRGQPASLNGASAGTKRKAEGNKDGNKVSGKDRVKAQRLRGQSGIGSDFRGWKSETEMQLRQQYD
ncbi:hypothetical protein ACHHYP_12975 [Achlya hypogyna]|uniref:Uncharacterized protein n=1 Tax=Achlya hypogyna TaxID=1202772 RepID=A0A1V9YGD8_ACHHY|nr:hypothetical protein ACHHYP_12975 [Achlya hypogyna]